jgi:hypothetical protein
MSIKHCIKEILKYLLPYGILMLIKKKKKLHSSIEEKQYAIESYFRNLSSEDENISFVEYFFKNNSFSAFPYGFVKKYLALEVIVYDDNICGMKYILHKNKKLYFPEDWTRTKIREYYNGLLIEQDKKSPHCYVTSSFHVEKNDVLLDIGAAEGIFALTYIDTPQLIYLIECDKNWIKPLEKTFEPYKSKVVIINKRVSDKDDKYSITCDSIINSISGMLDPMCCWGYFIKADVEGAEIDCIKGAENSIVSCDNMRIVVCTYHKKNDAIDLEKQLESYGVKTHFSDGLMIFDKDPPDVCLRKGVIRGIKRPLAIDNQL